ncbi:MAG: hypothetical protein GQ531_07745 [Sulfurovum sp.]|nr:hypothetical protein [Sulfurovum sp.]
MKNMIKSAVVITALVTSAQADFSFGALWDEMTEVLSSTTHDRAENNAKSTESVTVAVSTSQTATKEVAQ